VKIRENPEKIEKIKDFVKMLRSPAHLIGPTATATSDSPASRNGANGFHHHHHNQTHRAPTRPSSIFDSCHRKIRLIGGGPVAFLEGLVA
jgi:hypothetical protein